MYRYLISIIFDNITVLSENFKKLNMFLLSNLARDLPTQQLLTWSSNLRMWLKRDVLHDSKPCLRFRAGKNTVPGNW